MMIACADDGSRTMHIVDTGALCVRSQPTGELFVQVVAGDCASGCTDVVEASCEIQVTSGEIVVHSSFRTEERRGDDIVCPTACVLVAATCAPASAGPGQYTFRHGAASESIELPTDGQLLLADSAARAEQLCREAAW